MSFVFGIIVGVGAFALFIILREQWAGRHSRQMKRGKDGKFRVAFNLFRWYEKVKPW